MLEAINLDDDLAPLVVASDDDTVTFSIDVDATVNFDAEFNFSVKDGIGRDYVPLGSSSETTAEVVKFPMVITVTRSVDPMPEFVDAEVTRTRITADFGYAEPDWLEEAYENSTLSRTRRKAPAVGGLPASRPRTCKARLAGDHARLDYSDGMLLSDSG